MDPASHAQRPRLFVAIEIPAPAQETIEEALRPWRDRLQGARWVRPGSRHVTLAFLGSVDEERVPWVRERLREQAAASPAIEGVATTEMGSFPAKGRARVLWAGLSDPGGRLGTLAASVRAALAPVTERMEDRPLRAHVTLARFAPPLRLPDGLLGTKVGPTEIPISRLALFRSDPGGSGGPRYTIEGAFPLVTQP